MTVARAQATLLAVELATLATHWTSVVTMVVAMASATVTCLFVPEQLQRTAEPESSDVARDLLLRKLVGKFFL